MRGQTDLSFLLPWKDKMIPRWKIKRELDRLAVQLRAIPQAAYEPFQQRHHDQTREYRITRSDGDLPLKSHLALFLIFQPAGIPDSVLQTCHHLISEGFAPIIISNAGLTQEDRGRLQAVSHLVVERPNFGYDFGGYRDGVWLANRLGLQPESVLFLNDSVWFPVLPDSTLLKDMLASPADYVGTQVFGDINGTGRNKGFFGSYCFLVRSDLWQQPEFQMFWQNLRLSSNKEVTLRRGERAFSRQMIDVAKRSDALFDIARFDNLLAGLPRDGLKEAIRDMVVTDPGLVVRRDTLLADGIEVASEDEMRNLLYAATRSKNYIGAAPVLSIRDLGFPMIKKNNERHYMLARAQILRANSEGRLANLDKAVIKEMRTRRPAKM